MSTFREDVLLGSKAAAELFQEIRGERFIRSPGGLDVYGLASELDVPVVFRGLSGLLGVYLNKPTPGIMITTQRPYAVQRFTCAHELGHFFLRHDESFDGDDQVGTAVQGIASMERQANAFAVSLLMPRWLVTETLRHLLQQGLRLPDAIAVYQLSLRLGCSYEATVRTLANYKMIPTDDENALLAIEVKSIKKRILGDVSLPTWHPNVWLLTEGEDGRQIEAVEQDVVVMRVVEASTSGYVSRTLLEPPNTALLNEAVRATAGDGHQDVVGGPSTYEAIVAAAQTGAARLAIHQGRPWEQEEEKVLGVRLEIVGPEAGLSRSQRRRNVGELS